MKGKATRYRGGFFHASAANRLNIKNPLLPLRPFSPLLFPAAVTVL